LITSLKADLASQSALAKETRTLKKKAELHLTETAGLKAQIAQLKASLEEAQSQNKTLSTKLAANRNAAASVESVHTKVSGSAVKANGGIRMMGTAEAAQAAQTAQLKEDLYSDLTGLIIRGVKREAEDEVFDCIQTGRNGSEFSQSHLHFMILTDKKLCILNWPWQTRRLLIVTTMRNANTFLSSTLAGTKA
jgi:seryl-tRNA synthetase